jgi:hypothetical protein
LIKIEKWKKRMEDENDLLLEPGMFFWCIYLVFYKFWLSCVMEKVDHKELKHYFSGNDLIFFFRLCFSMTFMCMCMLVHFFISVFIFLQSSSFNLIQKRWALWRRFHERKRVKACKEEKK